MGEAMYWIAFVLGVAVGFAAASALFLKGKGNK